MQDTPFGFHDEKTPPGQEITVTRGASRFIMETLLLLFFYLTGLAKVGTMFLLRVSVIATLSSIRRSINIIMQFFYFLKSTEKNIRRSFITSLCLT